MQIAAQSYHSRIGTSKQSEPESLDTILSSAFASASKDFFALLAFGLVVDFFSEDSASADLAIT